MTRKKDDKTQTAESKDQSKAKTGATAGQTATPLSGDADKPLPTQPGGGSVSEDAEAVYVKTRTAERFYRCGLAFGRTWRLVERKELGESDWQRLLAEPHLAVRCVVPAAEESAG